MVDKVSDPEGNPRHSPPSQPPSTSASDGELDDDQLEGAVGGLREPIDGARGRLPGVDTVTRPPPERALD